MRATAAKHRRLGSFCNRKLSLTIQAEVHRCGAWAGAFSGCKGKIHQASPWLVDGCLPLSLFTLPFLSAFLCVPVSPFIRTPVRLDLGPP